MHHSSSLVTILIISIRLMLRSTYSGNNIKTNNRYSRTINSNGSNKSGNKRRYNGDDDNSNSRHDIEDDCEYEHETENEILAKKAEIEAITNLEVRTLHAYMHFWLSIVFQILICMCICVYICIYVYM